MRVNRSNTNGWLSLDSLAAQFLKAKQARKDANIEYDSLKATTIARLGGKQFVETDRHTIAYVNHPKQIVDVKRLEIERPDIYKKYLTPSNCWTLTVDEKKTEVA